MGSGSSVSASQGTSPSATKTSTAPAGNGVDKIVADMRRRFDAMDRERQGLDEVAGSYSNAASQISTTGGAIAADVIIHSATSTPAAASLEAPQSAAVDIVLTLAPMENRYGGRVLSPAALHEHRRLVREAVVAASVSACDSVSDVTDALTCEEADNEWGSSGFLSTDAWVRDVGRVSQDDDESSEPGVCDE